MNASEPREDAVAVLPPLPEVPHMYCPGCEGDIPMYDAGQMHAYAIAALQAQQGAEPVSMSMFATRADYDAALAAPKEAGGGAGAEDVRRLQECESAWMAIVETLDERSPGWRGTTGRCMDHAVNAIRRLTAPSKEAGVDIDAAVNRFLGWKLPKDFHPDSGISFAPTYFQQGENADLHWPVGTNLLSADQAKAMFAHCLAAPQADQQGEDDGEKRARKLYEPDDYEDYFSASAKPSDQQGASTAPVDRADYAVALATIESLRLRLGGCERALADRDEQLAALASKDQQGASLEGDVIAAIIKSRLFSMFLRQGFWHASHVDLVWRYNGQDVREEADWLKDLWYRVKDAPLASKASPDDQRQEGAPRSHGSMTTPDWIRNGPQPTNSAASPPTEAAAAVGEAWFALVARIAALVNCLPSTFADGNEHVVKAVAALSPTASAAREGS